MNAITEFMSKHFAPAHRQPEVIAARQTLAAGQLAAIVRQEAVLYEKRDHADALWHNAIINDALMTAHIDAMYENSLFDMRAMYLVIQAADTTSAAASLSDLRASDLARCDANVANLLADMRGPVDLRSLGAYIDAGLSVAELTDDDILEFGVEWDLDTPALVARLEEFCVRARDVMGVTA